MVFSLHSLAIAAQTPNRFITSIHTLSSASSSSLTSSSSSSTKYPSPGFVSSHQPQNCKLSLFHRYHGVVHKARAEPQKSETTVATAGYAFFTEFKHLLLPITDRTTYLSDGTRQAVSTTALLAKKYGADITVVIINENQKESLPEYETQLSSIRWHLSQGGYEEFRLLERLGDKTKPTLIISDVADELNLDLVVLSMEAIHSKQVDANLLAEFIPCPVVLLPL